MKKYQVKEIWIDWKEYIRTRVETWTRVMWYHRPVSSYNIGKKCEFYSRANFTESSGNKEFNTYYAN